MKDKFTYTDPMTGFSISQYTIGKTHNAKLYF
jgi:hypothetical protein